MSCVRSCKPHKLTSSRGLVPNMIKVTPSIAVSFYTFETVKDLLASLEHVEEDHSVV